MATSTSTKTTAEVEEEIDLNELLHGASLELDDHPEIVTAQRVINCRCELGECVLYDDVRHAVYFTDIYGRTFHRLQLGSSSADGDKTKKKILYSAHRLPKKLCSFGLLEGGGAQQKKDGEDCSGQKQSSLPLLCAWEDGFQMYDVVAGVALGGMSEGDDVNPNKGSTRLNDGRTDPTGHRFVCGGYYGGGGANNNKEKVFKVEQRRKGGGGGAGDAGEEMELFHEPIVNEIQTTNSICWTLDGKRMYLADSETREIHSYAYNVDGSGASSSILSDKKLLHEKPADDKCVPDGSCVDSQGYLWNAVWCTGEAKGMVVRIDPGTGHVVYTVHVPDLVSQVSCCCFGGTDLDILFITTARDGRDAQVQPHAGALYAARVPFKGRPESRLKFAVPAACAAEQKNVHEKEPSAAADGDEGEQSSTKRRASADAEDGSNNSNNKNEAGDDDKEEQERKKARSSS